MGEAWQFSEEKRRAQKFRVSIFDAREETLSCITFSWCETPSFCSPFARRTMMFTSFDVTRERGKKDGAKPSELN